MPSSPWAAKELGTPSHTFLTFITIKRKRFVLGQSGKGRNYRTRAHQEDSQLRELQGKCEVPHLSHFSFVSMLQALDN